MTSVNECTCKGFKRSPKCRLHGNDVPEGKTLLTWNCPCKDVHVKPVHAHFHGGGSAWLCLECGAQMSGKKLPPAELQAVIEFAKFLEETNQPKEKKTMEISVTVTGTTPLEVAEKLSNAAKVWGSKPAAAAARTTRPAKPAAAPAPVIEEPLDEILDEPLDGAEELLDEPLDGADFNTPAPAAAAKPAAGKGKKKLTEKDINEAAIAYAGRHNADKKGRARAFAVLEKFGVKSVLELKPEQYESVIAALSK